MAVDIVPLAPDASNTEEGSTGLVEPLVCDLTDWRAVDQLFAGPPYDAVIHFGAIPDPLTLDPRVVHNTNVVSSYNVLQSAASHGVRRISTASSVNAIGMGFSPKGHKVLERVPITEEERITCVSCFDENRSEKLGRPILSLQGVRLHHYFAHL